MPFQLLTATLLFFDIYRNPSPKTQKATHRVRVLQFDEFSKAGFVIEHRGRSRYLGYNDAFIG